MVMLMHHRTAFFDRYFYYYCEGKYHKANSSQSQPFQQRAIIIILTLQNPISANKTALNPWRVNDEGQDAV
jgi:hypothetical protein